LTQKEEKSGDWRIGSDGEVDLKGEKISVGRAQSYHL